MKIDFKQPRYVLPVVVLPFLLLLFYAFQSSSFNTEKKMQSSDSLQAGLAEVSAEVQSRAIGGKLDAFRDRFKQADGYTAVNGLAEEAGGPQQAPESLYNEREKFMLDSLAKLMKDKPGTFPNTRALTAGYQQAKDYATNPDRSEKADQALRKALSEINRERPLSRSKPDDDPMQIFRAQLSLIDSMSKANDPSARSGAVGKAGAAVEKTVAEKILQVRKSVPVNTSFTTIISHEKSTLIPAMLDEELTVFSGSRLRIRLLEEVMAGPYLLPRQSYLYAQVSGFSSQRVLLSVNSAFVNGEILPLKLEVYDNDGLPGIYVPASAFREFSKDLSSSAASAGTSASIQTENRMAMSLISGVFQSANAAVNKLIRRNKARLKYDTRVYLVDSESLKNKQNSHK